MKGAEKPGRFEEECRLLNAAVDDFACAMKAKLREKAAKGWEGWDQEENMTSIRENLLTHAARLFCGQDEAVDVANFAMMLHVFRS